MPDILYNQVVYIKKSEGRKLLAYCCLSLFLCSNVGDILIRSNAPATLYK